MAIMVLLKVAAKLGAGCGGVVKKRGLWKRSQRQDDVVVQESTRELRWTY